MSFILVDCQFHPYSFTGWPKFAKAYALKDWETAKKELERKGVGTERTDELAKFIETGRKKLNQ